MTFRAWLRFSVVITARAAVAIILGMTFWAVGPLAIGWHTTTVMTDSMAPAIQTGDLVVSRPVPVSDLHPGQVLLARDPDHAGRLRLHRLHEVHGTELITKGDANPQPDSTPIHRNDVIGVGYLRVPWIGIPITQANNGNTTTVIITILTLTTLVATAATRAVRDTEPATDHNDDEPGQSSDPRIQGRHRADTTTARTAPTHTEHTTPPNTPNPTNAVTIR